MQAMALQPLVSPGGRLPLCAGLVKLLRKCVRELGSRTSLYVDECMKVEKELVKQVRSVAWPLARQHGRWAVMQKGAIWLIRVVATAVMPALVNRPILLQFWHKHV